LARRLQKHGFRPGVTRFRSIDDLERAADTPARRLTPLL
jgi:hypothetical protein